MSNYPKEYFVTMLEEGKRYLVGLLPETHLSCLMESTHLRQYHTEIAFKVVHRSQLKDLALNRGIHDPEEWAEFLKEKT